MAHGTRVVSFAHLFVDSQFCDHTGCTVAQAVIDIFLLADGSYRVEIRPPGGECRVAILAGERGPECAFMVGCLHAMRRVGEPISVGV